MRPLALVWVGALVLVAWMGLMWGATWFVYHALDVRMHLHQQPVALRLPAGMQAVAALQAPVHTRLDLRPRVQVPVRQTLSAEVSDQLDARVNLQTTVPVRTSLHVKQVVPVRTRLMLKVPVVSWLPPFEVEVPVALDLPLRLTVPVHVDVPLRLDAVVSGALKAPLQVPLDAVFDLRPEIRAPLQARVQQQMAFQLHDAMPPIPLVIEQADLLAPFRFPVMRNDASH